MSDASKLARDHDKEAIGVILEVMRDPLAEFKDRLKAAEALLDRGHGKAAQAIIAIPASKKVAAEAAGMTEDQLLDIIRAEQLPRLAEPVIEADFSEVEEDIDPLLR